MLPAASSKIIPAMNSNIAKVSATIVFILPPILSLLDLRATGHPHSHSRTSWSQSHRETGASNDNACFAPCKTVRHAHLGRTPFGIRVAELLPCPFMLAFLEPRELPLDFCLSPAHQTALQPPMNRSRCKCWFGYQTCSARLADIAGSHCIQRNMLAS